MDTDRDEHLLRKTWDNLTGHMGCYQVSSFKM